MKALQFLIALLIVYLVYYVATYDSEDVTDTQTDFGPAFLFNDCADESRKVDLRFYDSENLLIQEYRRLGRGDLANKVHGGKGFATEETWKLPSGERFKVQVLHTLAPRGVNDADRMETLGHELLHAFCGRWHKPIQ